MSLKNFIESMITFIDDPKVFTNKVLEIMKELSKTAGHRINIKTSFMNTWQDIKTRKCLLKEIHLQ